MATWQVATTTPTQGTVNQAAHTVKVTVGASYDFLGAGSGDGDYSRVSVRYGVGAYTFQEPTKIPEGLLGVGWFQGSTNPPGGSIGFELGSSSPGYNTPSEVEADRTYQYQGVIDVYTAQDITTFQRSRYGANINQKTNAVDMTADAPIASGVTHNAAIISDNFYPNTFDSTVSAQLQYKRSVDPGWTDAGAPSTGNSGYAVRDVIRSISGLTPSTQYDVRCTFTRTTNNQTTFTSTTIQFTTSAVIPTITTGAGQHDGTGTGATLNGVVNPNGGATTYRFQYGLTVSYGTETALQGPSSSSSDVPFSDTVAGLTPNTVYHFRAKATAGGTDYFGADATFVTDNSGHIMPTVYQYFAKYGVARTFRFCVETPASTGSDKYLDAAVPWVAGDVRVSIDGGAIANVNALPTRLGSTPIYEWAAIAAELAGTDINVILSDASGGPLWRDCHIQITTKLLLGQIDVDATQIGGNTSAVSLIGVGTGYGLFAKGSSGVRAEALAAAGHGISAVGSTSGLGISALGGASGQPCNLFDTKEGAELVPGDLSDNMEFGQIMQLLKVRHAHKVTQDSDDQTWYKANSVDVLKTRVVSDDTVTQVQNKLY